MNGFSDHLLTKERKDSAVERCVTILKTAPRETTQAIGGARLKFRRRSRVPKKGEGTRR